MDTFCIFKNVYTYKKKTYYSDILIYVSMLAELVFAISVLSIYKILQKFEKPTNADVVQMNKQFVPSQI